MFLTRSGEKVLINAGLIDETSEINLPNGWKKDENVKSSKKFESVNDSSGWKHNPRYNAMGMMINRIRSFSSVTQKNKSEQANNVVDDVFMNPDMMKHSMRASVIKPRTCLQEHYNVPVQNMYSQLLN